MMHLWMNRNSGKLTDLIGDKLNLITGLAVSASLVGVDQDCGSMAYRSGGNKIGKASFESQVAERDSSVLSGLYFSCGCFWLLANHTLW